MKKEKVPVQKGPITPHQAQQTMKFCTRTAKEMEDTDHAILKRSMQTMDMFEPRK